MSRKFTIAPTAKALPMPMSSKPKSPARPAATPRVPRQRVTNPRPQANSRWQHTVRYGWDKGGAHGGRK